MLVYLNKPSSWMSVVAVKHLDSRHLRSLCLRNHPPNVSRQCSEEPLNCLEFCIYYLCFSPSCIAEISCLGFEVIFWSVKFFCLRECSVCMASVWRTRGPSSFLSKLSDSSHVLSAGNKLMSFEDSVPMDILYHLTVGILVDICQVIF